MLDEFTGVQARGLDVAFRRGEQYLPMIRAILAEEGLPEELAYLALVESSFHPHARSPADAVGLWQFIESTGRASGLRIDWWVDERLDPEAATRAAAAHLKELYGRFGDWDLALAAYNAGPGGVARARASAQADCYWELSAAGALRAETRRYVPKFYAAVQLARDREANGGQGAGGSLPYETVAVDTPVDLHTAARLAGSTPAELRELNPALKRGCTPPGPPSYRLRVPHGTARRVRDGLAAIPPAERLAFQRYQVRSGDSLWEIARRHGTPASAVAELNGLADPRRLRPGQELVIPVARGRAASEVARGGEAVGRGRRGSSGIHVVQAGETVWGIARLHGVATADVLRWNGLGPSAAIRPGDRVAVAPPPRAKQGAAAAPRVHVVQAGESLWAISRRYGVPLPELLERNGLTPPVILRPGDRITVAAAGDPG
ncbi:MAG: LysM peptidoglycan-binding domain-containing protein [Deferrisomatales bacterium]|nr:LysM peptidoglycan-binding domain-containing protein [Deferrisomatales bacterium]